MTLPTVLVVEDDPDMLKIVRTLLEKAGHVVVEAQSGAAALACLERGAPDLVLQDLLLPDMDGFELPRRLRELAGGAQIAFVALTGLTSRADQARALAAGFASVLVKPVDVTVLVQTVARHLPARIAPRPSAPTAGGRRRPLRAPARRPRRAAFSCLWITSPRADSDACSA